MLFHEFSQVLGIQNILLDRLQDTVIPSLEIHTNFLKKHSIYFHWKVGQENLSLIDIAVKKGAIVLTSERGYANSSNPQIIYISSVRKVLTHLAKMQREKFKGQVIAVTGSVGKSSVKNMLSQVLSMKYQTLSTYGNENAWLGIYCTLANIELDTEYVVLETGASGPNTLSVPIQLVQPTISILLDVNFSHQEKYNNFKELVLEKASIIDALQSGGKLVISNQVFQQLKAFNYTFRKDITIDIVGTQADHDANFKIDNIFVDHKKVVANIYTTQSEKITVTQPNKANAINAIYSWVVLKTLGMELNQFNALIAFYKSLPRRFERIRVCNQQGKIFELIDDAYNTSPASALNAFQSIEYRAVKRKFLVFGDMLELGEESRTLHQVLLNDISLKQFDQIILVGPISQACNLLYQVNRVESIEDAFHLLKHLIVDGDLILLKASNGMNFYQLRKLLEAQAVHIQSATDWFIEDEFPLKM